MLDGLETLDLPAIDLGFRLMRDFLPPAWLVYGRYPEYSEAA